MKVGIAITTTPSRKDIFDICLENIKRTMPDDCVLYVHNDTEGLGVAKSKNNCISYLMHEGCDYLFLFDDDCWSLEKGFEQVFINSGLHYSCPTFSHWKDGTPYLRGDIKYGGDVEIYPNAAGVVLFFTRQCIEQVGGMNILYGKYGWEHLGQAHRICNAGLTVAPFLAPKGSFNLFKSLDQEQCIVSTVTNKERKTLIEKTRNIYNLETKSSDWMPYKKDSYALTFCYGENIGEDFENCIVFNDMPKIDTSSRFKSILSNKGKYSGHYKAFSDMQTFLKNYRYYFDEVYITDNMKVGINDNLIGAWQIGCMNILWNGTIQRAKENWHSLPPNIRRQFPMPQGEGRTADCSLIGGKIKDVLFLLDIMVDKMKKCPEIDTHEYFMYHTCVHHIPNMVSMLYI